MNTLEQRVARLEALTEAIEKAVCPQGFSLSLPEQPTTPKPRCDAQGRLLAPLKDSETYWGITNNGLYAEKWDGFGSETDALAYGHLFISQPAAEAELTRLKCLQRLRGMEGFNPHGNAWGVSIDNYVILDGFENYNQSLAAEATITPEERAAFLYREPMGEK